MSSEIEKARKLVQDSQNNPLSDKHLRECHDLRTEAQRQARADVSWWGKRIQQAIRNGNDHARLGAAAVRRIARSAYGVRGLFKDVECDITYVGDAYAEELSKCLGPPFFANFCKAESYQDSNGEYYHVEAHVYVGWIRSAT